MKTLLEENSSLFTMEEKGWHGMSVLGFSAFMSLISITMAQFSVYTTRHEFDMTLSGKAIYILREGLIYHTLQNSSIAKFSLTPLHPLNHGILADLTTKERKCNLQHFNS